MANEDTSFAFKRGSWLKNCGIARLDDGTISWSFFKVPNIPARESDLVVVLDKNSRPEQIAKEHYGKYELWWVICIANGFRMPFVDLRPGQEIRVPSPEVILAQVREEGAIRG